MASTLLQNPPAHSPGKVVISLPFGLIGLRQLTRFELEPISGSWPFLRFRALEGESVELIVVEPHTVLDEYPIHIGDEDAEELRLSEGNDALVLNIVTVHSFEPQFVTLNLIGPVVVNRETMLGKQVILANSEQYSVAHVLVDLRGDEDSGKSGR